MCLNQLCFPGPYGKGIYVVPKELWRVHGYIQLLNPGSNKKLNFLIPRGEITYVVSKHTE